MWSALFNSLPNQSSSALVRVRVPTHVNIVDNYPMEKSKSNSIKPIIRKRDASLNLYGERKKQAKPTMMQIEKQAEPTMMQIEKHPRVEMNRKLIIAKCSNFSEESACHDFAISLKNMIMDGTTIGRDINENFGDRSIAVCRFLKIFVTDDERFYLMPLRHHIPYDNNSSVWVEDSFTYDRMISNPNFQRILTELLTMVKRHKRLINKPGNLVINLEFFLNRRREKGNKDAFHVDVDVFEGSSNPEYISVTNTSQRGYGLSTEIKHADDNKSYTLLAGPCQTIILRNSGSNIVHRSPSLQLINRERYDEPDVLNRVETFHQSSLTDEELTSKVVTDLNKDMSSRYEPRNIIRMLISEQTSMDNMTNMIEVTHLIPGLVYVSPVVNYVITVFDRDVDREEEKQALLHLKDYSIGGKTKKNKKRSKKHIKLHSKKRGKRYTKKRIQRGGTKPTDFAVYANDDKTLQFFEGKLVITDEPLSLTYG